MSSQKGRSVFGRYSFSLSFVTTALLAGAAFLNLAVPDAAQSQISSKAISAPFSKSSAHLTTARLPKAPAQVEMPAPPPIKIFPGLFEPLVATGPVSDEEGKDLDAALKAFHDAPAKAAKGSDYDDFGKPLLAFIDTHPQSNWNAALYLNIALGYYNAGYNSRVFGYLEKSWQLGRNATTPQAHMMIDRAVSELAEMHAKLGHKKELQDVLANIGNRPIGGPATELIQGAREGLAAFLFDTKHAYLCGPKALVNVLTVLKADQKLINIADRAFSGPHGYSLTQLAQLADKTKLKYTIIHREAGQPIPVPSVLHWKNNHYAAIIGQVDGYYTVQDPTFLNSGMAVTQKALDQESSGYFLVPAAAMPAIPNAGWRVVAKNSAEAKGVYGMGMPSDHTGQCTSGCNTDKDDNQDKTGQNSVGQGCAAPPADPNPKDPDPDPDHCPGQSADQPPSDQGMTVASAQSMTVNLRLHDTPIGYAPQVGSIAQYTTITYNHREAMQPATFGFSNLSAKWNTNWQDYVEDNPTNVQNGGLKRIYGGGGGWIALAASQHIGSNGYYDSDEPNTETLIRVPFTPPITQYMAYTADGGTKVYGLSDGATTNPRRWFLTSIIDPMGNTTTINYDSSLRITSVVDPMGRSTTFTYGLSAYPLLVTQITDGFSRTTQFTYDTSARLASITDPAGITSSYTYSSTEPTFVTSLTTPYGTSSFNDTPNPNDTNLANRRSLTMTDPLGYVDYLYSYNIMPGIPATLPSAQLPAGMSVSNWDLQTGNSAYWNRHKWAVCVAAGGCSISSGVPQSQDFTKAKLSHWSVLLARQYDAELNTKEPLEYAKWNNWFGSTTTISHGNLDKATNIGHVLDDGTTQLAARTYNAWNANAKLATYTDAVGRVTKYNYLTSATTGRNLIDLSTIQQLTTSPSTYTTFATFGSYNTQHEPQTYTGADGQTWNYTYNTVGQLKTIKDPNLNTTTYNYDATGRLSTIVDANSQTVLTSTYDSADRVQTQTDSQGYTLTYAYDNLDRITSITYPDGTTDLYDYNFQSGPHVGTASLELRKYTDRLGRVTTYDYDADRRLSSVTEPTSGTSTRTTQYAYYEDGTLKEITDANNNVTHWDIDLQSRPIDKIYAYGTGSAQTETYAWENTSSRLHSITDALGQVKTFAYTKDNRVAGITYTSTVNPTPNVTFTYDTYFPRLSSMMDGIGTTNYSYTAIGGNGALKLSSIDGPYGNDTIGFTYDAIGRLSGRNITGGNETLGYDAIDRLTSHGTPLGSFTIAYLGETDQLASQSVTNGSVTVSTNWGYDTNTSDRRLISIANSGVSRSYTLGYGSSPVNVYDIISITDTAATGHPWATQSHGYTYDKIDRLLTESATTPGNSTFAYDNLDNATTWNTPASGSLSPTFNGLNQLSTFGTSTYSYDANGNTLSGDGTKTYKWDAENRLIEIDYVGTSNKTTFAYDGIGHRTIQADTIGGTTTTKRFMWCGDAICQTRDGSDNVLRRDLWEGEYILSSGQKLVYMPDQLRSVRDVLDATTGNLVQSYDYTPYGGVARSNGSTPTDYEFGMLFYHPASGLNISATRALDGVTGRWINRDSILEEGGLNLYAYAGANTINAVDPVGETIKYKSGRWIDCGNGCRIRIDTAYSDVAQARHLHWECKGRGSGECGEHGRPSHGGTWDEVPEKVKQCARENGFQGDPVPSPAPKTEPPTVPNPVSQPNPVPRPGIPVIPPEPMPFPTGGGLGGAPIEVPIMER
jgi:RHS repeat-associated protein